MKSSIYSKSNNQLNILVLGPTGTGKSTFINFLYCRNKNIKLIDKILIKNFYIKDTISDEDTEFNPDDQSHSQTQFPKTYEIDYSTNEKLNFKIKVIDTPGFCDSQGDIIQDDFHFQQILKNLLELENISAIVLVFNGKGCRRQDEISKYTLLRLVNNIPDSYFPNLILLFTHTFDLSDLDGFIKLVEKKEKFVFDKKNIFAFDNVTFLESSYKDNSDYLLDYEDLIEKGDTLVKRISELDQKDLKIYNDMFIVKNVIQMNLFTLQYNLRLYYSTQEKLDSLMVYITENLSFLSDGDAYHLLSEKRLQNINIICKKIQTNNFYSTICLFCNRNCHYICELEKEVKTIGHKSIEACEVFNNDGNFCSKCNCSAESHVHSYYSFFEQFLDILLFGEKNLYNLNLEEMKQYVLKKKDQLRSLILEQLLPKSIDVINLEILKIKKIVKNYDFVEEKSSALNLIDKKLDSKYKLTNSVLLSESRKSIEMKTLINIKRSLTEIINGIKGE